MELKEIKSLVIEHVREKYVDQIPTIYKKESTYRLPFTFQDKKFEFLICGQMIGVKGYNIMPSSISLENWLDARKPYCLDELDKIIEEALNVKHCH